MRRRGSEDARMRGGEDVRRQELMNWLSSCSSVDPGSTLQCSLHTRFEGCAHLRVQTI